MVKSTRAAWLLAVALIAGVALVLGHAPEVQAAKAAAAPKMNPAVLKPLQAALELINGGKFAEAEAELQKADAVSACRPADAF